MRVTSVLAFIALFLFGCATPKSGSINNDNPNGGYLAVAPYYWSNHGTLYATDEEHTYWLQKPFISAGKIGGTQVDLGEVWLRIDGSTTQGYYRSPATFRNQTLKPVFIAY